ncbi:MAG: cysteine--tRNA ligase [Myxococcaceae bacterium]
MPLPIQVFNTLNQNKFPLTPIEPGKVGIYVCGPTVYGHIHIGNARTFTSFDTVVRYLRHAGYQVRYVRNYTDVDDKIIRGAKVVGTWKQGGAEVLKIGIDNSCSLRGQPATFYLDGNTLKATAGGKTEDFEVTAFGLSSGGAELQRDGAPVDATAFAQHFIDQFERDATSLHLLKPDVSPKVSETIPEIVAIIQKLIARGFAYESKGDVYFEVRKFPEYTRLSKRNLDDMKEGASGRVDSSEQKKDPLDFALWKTAKPGEVSWDSPWGKGRPGWHIECSAMSSKFLGDHFDLHGGGLDLIFPHHTNEKAQSEAASGVELCNCWMHGGFLDLEGAKMSKSLGNVVRLVDALKQVDPEALRFFFLSTHYRSPLSFSDKSLADCEARLEYFYETLQKLSERLAGKTREAGPVHGDPAALLTEFDSVASDDFNFAGSLGVLSNIFGEINMLTDKPPVKDKPLIARTLFALQDVVKKIGLALGLFEEEPSQWLLKLRDRRVKAKGIDPANVEAKIAERQAARAAKDFARSDAIRAEMKTLGVELMDGPQGTRWKVC